MMKHFYEKILPGLCVVLGINLTAKAQTKTENYILTSELLEATTDTTKSNLSTKSRIDKITYFDGLGREKMSIVSPKAGLSIETMALSGQLLNPSLATTVTYDGFGRVDREYLPGVVPNLNFTTAINYADYPETSNLYSQKKYEDSPLNRVLKQGAPGAAWEVNTNRAIGFDYQTNQGDHVLMFGINQNLTNSGNNIALTITETYQNGTLYKTTTTDENGQPIIEFKDKQARVVLKRIRANGKEFNTYYVYDIYGNLACVLPPKLMQLANNTATNAVYTPLLKELAYQYRYDDKNRLIEKKLPGKDWEYMVYDKQDRLVATQDALLRTEGKWMFTKYDKFARVAVTGIVFSGTRADVQNWVTASFGNNNVERDAQGYVYDNLQIFYKPTAFGEGGYPLTVNYYDDYPTAQQGVSLTGNVLGQTVATGNRLKGMPTLTITRSLGTWENNQWNFEHNYTLYDNKYLRAVKNHKINYLRGSTIVESELDFRGKATKVVTTHKRLENNFPVKTTEVFSYDKFERLLRHTHQINTGKVEVLTQNSYNNIGQLTSKKVGNTTASPYQTVDYQYNIRGWLTQINDITNLGTDLFAFKINYNTKDQTKASNATQELFNGNIAQTLWTSQENPYIRSYDYNYDGLNRLTNAGYSNLSKDFAGTYDEQLSYDHNGNILTLKRYGQTEQATSRLIDNLTYNYENAEKSNRLLKVTDSSNTLGFNDGNKTGNDYTYDVNGNLKIDLNKGIEIEYNHLNLPTLVKKGAQTIEYAYSATGVKLRKIVKAQQGVNAGLTTTTTEYLDGFQYKDGVLQFFPTTEGYVNAITAGTVAYNYVYNLTDHLGNVRVSYAWDDVNSKLKTVNEDHYYPFGLQHKGYNKPPKDMTAGELGEVEIGIGIGSNSGSANYKYRYNGKELQEELNLNLYDYGARNYDPAIGRWFNIDPLAEKYYEDSPFTYALNNPVYFIDIDGMQIGGPGDGTGTEEDPIELDEVIVKVKKQERRDPIFGYNYNSDTLNENSRKLSTTVANYKPAQQIDAIINETTFFVLTLPLGGVAFKGASFILKPVITKTGTIIWRRVASKAVLEAVEGSASKTIVETTKQVAKTLSPYELEITHGLTKSKKAFQLLKENIRKNGIQESIKYVEHNGKKFVVDGHHRLRAAKELGMDNVPVQQVQMPYGNYKTIQDLIYSTF
ncbi:DUF6443 domain-containing protein [Empedobacter brevis]